MKKETKGNITRRTFIKGTAAGAGIIAATGGGLIGKGLDEAQAATQPKKYSFETPPPPIPESEIKEALTADVIVIGAGVSGMFAAASAREAGASVILIEKSATFGARGGDNTAINSKLHKKLGIELDKDRIVRELMKWGGSRLDASLLYLWANNSGMVMDWLIDILEAEGLPTYLVVPDRRDAETAVIDSWPHPASLPPDWNYLDERVVENPTCHRPGKIGDNQAGWLGVVGKHALKIGVEIRYETKAKQLIRDGTNGRVTAVVAQNADGYMRLNATKAVVLCTGDYGANAEMVAKYGNLLPGRLATSMGEGHQMAMWIGAVMENPPHCPMSHSWGTMGPDAFLCVSKFGKRFYSEDSDPEGIANQAYEQDGFWQVFDDSWPEDVPKMGAGFFKIFKATETVKKEFQAKVDRGAILKADTIDELATKMKVPVETFKGTIARYNELCYAGKDLDFGKRADRMTPVDKAPFYAGWSAKPTAALVVIGGLLTNEKLQPLDASGNVIPGLYLAGNTVGRRFKGGYPVICPGLSHGIAETHGYLAGKFAAADEG
jgi:fumarate reductase flavoprotein subunit